MIRVVAGLVILAAGGIVAAVLVFVALVIIERWRGERPKLPPLERALDDDVTFSPVSSGSSVTAWLVYEDDPDRKYRERWWQLWRARRRSWYIERPTPQTITLDGDKIRAELYGDGGPDAVR